MDNQPKELDINRYLQALFSHRHLFLVLAAAITALIVVASYVVPRDYEASSTVSIEKNYLNVLMQDVAMAPSLDERGHALSVVMMSRSMLLRVLADLGIEKARLSEAAVEKIVKRFQKKTQIKIEMNRSGRSDLDLFTVSFVDSDPQFARDYVNTLIDRYILESLSTKRQEAIGANRFVFEQMDLYKARIDRTEAELEQRKKEQGVQLTENLATLQHRLDELLVQYTDRHPEVARLRAEIASTRAQIEAKRNASAETASGERNASARTRGEGVKTIADLERDREAYKKIYESLVASIGRSEVSAQAQVQAKADTFRILDPAVLPIQPLGPARWKIILLGIIAGIVGSATIVIMRDMMDRSVRDVDALREIGSSVIGVIPKIQILDTIIAERRKDRIMYGAAGAYFLGMMVLVAVEFMK